MTPRKIIWLGFAVIGLGLGLFDWHMHSTVAKYAGDFLE